MADDENFDSIIERIEAAQDVGDMRSILADIESGRLAPAARAYLRGYALYCLPERPRSRLTATQIEAAFLEASDADEFRASARLYLAHLAYDGGDHARARSILAQVDPSALSPLFAIKRCELDACCAIHLDGVIRSQLLLDELVEMLSTLMHLPIYPPLNLTHVLRTMAGMDRFPKADREAASVYLERLRRLELRRSERFF